MTNKVYMVETVKWIEEDGDWDNEEQYLDLTGIQAMKMIAEFLDKHPNAREADIASDPDDGMFISLVDRKENGDEDWIDAYCMDKEP